MDVSFGVNIDRLTKVATQNNKVVYADDGFPYVNLRKEECRVSVNAEGKGTFETFLRPVIKPGTDIGQMLIHPEVGHPTKEPKGMSCAKGLPTPHECLLCNVCKWESDPWCLQTFLDYPVKRDDGTTVMDRVSISTIIKKMRPINIMTMMVVEPQFIADPPDFKPREDLPKDAQGIMLWWIKQGTLVSRVQKLIKSFVEDPAHFNDPERGHTFKITYDSGAHPTAMYSVEEGPSFAVPMYWYNLAPDAQKYIPKVRSNPDIITKLKEMIPHPEFNIQ